MGNLQEQGPGSFDPGGFFEFNLAQGAVRTSSGTRVLVLCDNVLAPLVSAAVQHGDLTAIRRLGKQIGEHILDSLGTPATHVAPEVVFGHTASVLALFGWGHLLFERWGEALVVAVDELPKLDDEHLGVAALLGGVFSTLASCEVACVPVGEKRFIVVDPIIAEQLWAWTKEGADVATIVGRLVEGSL